MLVSGYWWKNKMAAKEAKKLQQNDEEAKRLISSCDAFIFDLDGVLWLLDDPISGAAEFVNCLKQLGKKVFFITNCNTVSRDNFLKQFKKHGMEVDKSEVYTAAFAVAYYLKHIIKFDKKIYMLGGRGLSEELDEIGIPNIGFGHDEVTDPEERYNEEFELDPEVGGVVSGYDHLISTKKLIKATSYLVRDESCLFVVTNPDDRMPLPAHKNITAPGTGCFAAFLERAARRSPVYAGKPSNILFDCMVNEHGIDPAKTCMVGDTLNTDILFGNKCGTKTLLVFTGNATPDILDSVKSSTDPTKQECIPDYVIQSIANLLPFAKELLQESQ